ncbi:bacteriocin [Neisseria chenwenguii]|nr:bacteriocin [Neisseria chenwenguii]ROV54473.1 bacteriocin [Neisseria chenwenguii]
MKVLTQSELQCVSGGKGWWRFAGPVGIGIGLINAGSDAWSGLRDGWKSV